MSVVLAVFPGRKRALLGKEYTRGSKTGKERSVMGHRGVTQRWCAGGGCSGGALHVIHTKESTNGLCSHQRKRLISLFRRTQSARLCAYRDGRTGEEEEGGGGENVGILLRRERRGDGDDGEGDDDCDYDGDSDDDVVDGCFSPTCQKLLPGDARLILARANG